MAARRLIMVMLGLLGLSILISFFVPNRADRNEGGTTGATGVTSTTGPTGSTGTTGTKETAGSDGTNDGAAPSTISITATIGDGFVTICAKPEARLILTLKTKSAIDLSIPDFGRTATATRYAPAVFDLLLPKGSGASAVERLNDGRRLANIATTGCGRLGASLSSGSPRTGQTPGS